MKNRFFLLIGSALYIIASVIGVYYCIKGRAFNPLTGLAILILICILLIVASRDLSLISDRYRALKLMKTAVLICFCIYVIFLLDMTLFNAYYGRNILSRQISFELYINYFHDYVNLAPFKTIMLYIRSFGNKTISAAVFVTNIFGNIVAFMPFAFFLPILFKKMRIFKYFLLTITLVVIIIELSQFILLAGSCDIDDFLLNIFGSCIFYGILHLRFINQSIKKLFILEY